MEMQEIARCLPLELAFKLMEKREEVTEIRMRAGQASCLHCESGVYPVGPVIGAEELRRIALAMMDHSFYAREEELSKGFFTMKGGSRVGVAGTYGKKSDGSLRLRTISSLCIRIPREVRGCAAEAVNCILKGDRLKNALVFSKPGLGKTTMLRDIARILSTKGFSVGIADERHEIAACHEGVSAFDLGPHTDIIDGCSKGTAMEMLTRSLKPDVLITDEIGSSEDMDAIRCSARRGAAIVASAHAGSMDELLQGPLADLCREGLFGVCIYLNESPGKICDVRYAEEGIWNKGSYLPASQPQAVQYSAGS